VEPEGPFQAVSKRPISGVRVTLNNSITVKSKVEPEPGIPVKAKPTTLIMLDRLVSMDNTNFPAHLVRDIPSNIRLMAFLSNSNTQRDMGNNSNTKGQRDIQLNMGLGTEVSGSSSLTVTHPTNYSS
jgi:hypothetical protein